MGLYPGMALDSNDCPHISCGDPPLTYVWWTGSEWQIDVVVPDAWGGFTDIALDTNDRAHIISCGGYPPPLSYAHWTGTGWSVEIIDSGKTECKMSMNRISIVLDDNDWPHVIYSGSRGVRYAHYTGTEWLIETVATSGTEAPSIALDDNGYAHISYVSQCCVTYAHWTGLNWVIDTVDATGRYYTDYSCIALDSDDRPHISYGHGGGFLKYAYWTGTDWCIQVADTVNETARYTSLALDNNGYPHISYQDWGNYTLKYAHLRAGVEEEGNDQLSISNWQLSVHPNPFTRTTVISYRIPVGARCIASLQIHDAAGRLVKTLVNEEKEPGRHEVTWETRNLPAGIYFVRLAVGKDHKETRKLILVR
jgi:hypothetical protein